MLLLAICPVLITYASWINWLLKKALITSEFRLSLQSLKNSSTKQKLFWFNTMKLKKLWLCTKSFTVGMNLLRLLRNSSTKTSVNSKTITSNGFLKPTKKLKLPKLKNVKVITLPQFNFISKVVYLPKLLTVSPHTTSASHMTSLTRLLPSWSLPACTKKLVIFMKRWTSLIEHLTPSYKDTPSEKLLSLQREPSHPTL